MGRKLRAAEFDKVLPGGKGTEWLQLNETLKLTMTESGLCDLGFQSPRLRRQLRDELTIRIGSMPGFVQKTYRDDPQRCLDYLMLYAYKVKTSCRREQIQASKKQANRVTAATWSSDSESESLALLDSDTSTTLPGARRTKRRRGEQSTRRTAPVICLSDSETDAADTIANVATARPQTRSQKRQQQQQEQQEQERQQEKEQSEQEEEEQGQEQQRQHHETQVPASLSALGQNSVLRPETKLIIWDYQAVSYAELVNYLQEYERYDPTLDSIDWTDPFGGKLCRVSSEGSWEVALRKMGKLSGPSWLKLVRKPSGSETPPSYQPPRAQSHPSPAPSSVPETPPPRNPSSPAALPALTNPPWAAIPPWQAASPWFDDTPSPDAPSRSTHVSPSGATSSTRRLPLPTQHSSWAGRTRRRTARKAT